MSKQHRVFIVLEDPMPAEFIERLVRNRLGTNDEETLARYWVVPEALKSVVVEEVGDE